MKSKKQNLIKLADAFFENLQYDDGCEFGSIGVDCKRPFGNSYVEGDIAEIIGLDLADEEDDKDLYEEQMDYLRNLYCEELPKFLKKQWKKFRKGK